MGSASRCGLLGIFFIADLSVHSEGNGHGNRFLYDAQLRKINSPRDNDHTLHTRGTAEA